MWFKLKLCLSAIIKIMNSKDYIWMEVDGMAWQARIKRDEDGDL